MRLFLVVCIGVLLGSISSLTYKFMQNDVTEVNVERPKYKSVQFKSPFVIPLIEGGRVWSYVVISVALEVTGEFEIDDDQDDPVIRNEILSSLMSHENMNIYKYDLPSLISSDYFLNSINWRLKRIIGPSFVSVIIVDVNRRDI